MHLRMDGIARRMELLCSPERLEAWLRGCVSFVGMTVIGEPRVVSFPGSNGGGELTKMPGLSGDVILAESAVMVHTWPENGLVCVDIFSCKPFDVQQAAGFVRKSFDMSDYRWDATPRPLGMEA